MVFNGSSSFVADLQLTIDRAVAIASLPLTQLQNQRSVLANQSAALTVLGVQFENLQSAVESLDSTLNSAIHAASVTDQSIAKVTLGSNVLSADYSLEVLDLGARTLTMNVEGLPQVADPFTESISASSNFTLSVDGADYAVSPAGGSLFDLVSAINASGAGVQATIVNIGSSTVPDYRLSIQSEKFADVAIQLNDGGQDLLQTLTTGANVSYKVNGVPDAAIATDSRSVVLSPGVTVDLLSVGTTEISVAESPTNVADALAAFATAYNGVIDKLDLHRGTSGGVLNGQAILSTLARSLGNLVGFDTGTGNVRTLANLGLNVDSTGRLSLNRATAESLAVDDIRSFLGQSTTSGFLKAATDVLDTIQDSEDGLLELEKDSFQTRLQKQDKLIETNEERIQVMKDNLTARMAAADATLAVLEQQVSLVTGLLEAFRANKEALK